MDFADIIIQALMKANIAEDPYCDQLLAASEKGDLEAVKEAVENGAYLDVADDIVISQLTIILL